MSSVRERAAKKDERVSRARLCRVFSSSSTEQMSLISVIEPVEGAKERNTAGPPLSELMSKYEASFQIIIQFRASENVVAPGGNNRDVQTSFCIVREGYESFNAFKVFELHKVAPFYSRYLVKATREEG